MPSVLRRIRELLDERGVTYRVAEHGPTRTSEEAAAARGEPLSIGGKALMLRVGGEFRLFVSSAAARLDSGAIKRHFGVKKTRFASAEELLELTGLVPGSVPPFGEPILPVALYVDGAVRANERIAFNAGSLTTSIVMATPDWFETARPEVFRFAEDAQDPSGASGPSGPSETSGHSER